MIRYTLRYLKTVTLILTIVALFQNCVIYDKQPVSLEQAINVDHKIVNSIKVELTNNEILILDSLYYKKNGLYGLEIGTEVVKPTWSETKYTYSGEPYTYTYSTVEKIKAERNIEEDEIYQIFLPDRPKNNIYINISGDVSFYSINYERLFKVSPTLILAGG